MVGTMKAAQWDGVAKKLCINDIPIPEPSPEELVVKIHSASLCHSDLMHSRRPEETLTLGHEAVGHISKLHPSHNLKGLKVGDAVGFLCYGGSCFECEGCNAHVARCEKGGLKIKGFGADGFFAEYSLVDTHCVYKLPEKMDIQKAAPMFCAGLTAYQAIINAELKQGQWLAVIGCGGLGQYATRFAKAKGYNVVGIDVNDEVLKQTKSAGADAVFNSRSQSDYAEQVKKLTGVGGVHTAAVFSSADAAYRFAPDVLRPNGLLLIVGLADSDSIHVSTYDMCTAKYRVKAASAGPPGDIPEAVEFAAKHDIQPPVEYRKLEDLGQMMEDMEAGKAKLRQVVVF